MYRLKLSSTLSRTLVACLYISFVGTSELVLGESLSDGLDERLAALLGSLSELSIVSRSGNRKE